MIIFNSLDNNLEEINMPASIDTLSQDKKIIAQKVIDNLNALKPQAIIYNEQINAFKESLSSVGSMQDFFEIVQQIIAKGKEVHKVLDKAMEGMDSETKEAVNEYIGKDDGLTRVVAALHFDKTLSNSIVATKERLSKNIFNALPEAKKAIVEKFISAVKELKPIADLLDSQKKLLQQRLSEITLASELDKLEEEIIAQDKAISSVYTKMISYPKDEETAGVLMEYLETNHHLLATLKAFDFYESLVDDILAARAEITSHLSKKF